MGKKLRLIYIPFLLISGIFILAYTFLDWLLFIKLCLFSVREDIVYYWLPFALPWIPILLCLRRRICALQFKRNGTAFLYEMIAALAISDWRAFAGSR